MNYPENQIIDGLISANDGATDSELFRIYDSADRLIGLYKKDKNYLKPYKMFT